MVITIETKERSNFWLWLLKFTIKNVKQVLNQIEAGLITKVKTAEGIIQIWSVEKFNSYSATFYKN